MSPYIYPNFCRIPRAVYCYVHYAFRELYTAFVLHPASCVLLCSLCIPRAVYCMPAASCRLCTYMLINVIVSLLLPIRNNCFAIFMPQPAKALPAASARMPSHTAGSPDILPAPAFPLPAAVPAAVIFLPPATRAAFQCTASAVLQNILQLPLLARGLFFKTPQKSRFFEKYVEILRLNLVLPLSGIYHRNYFYEYSARRGHMSLPQRQIVLNYFNHAGSPRFSVEVS